MRGDRLAARARSAQSAVGAAGELDRIVGAHESGDERGRRAMEDLLRCAVLHDPARVEHGDAIGERQRLLAVVRDVHGRDADALLQGPQLVPQLDATL